MRRGILEVRCTDGEMLQRRPSRRSLILAGVVVALVAVFTVNSISVGDRIQGVVLWRADAEQPIPQEWASACTATNPLGAPMDPGDPRITRVTTPAAQGTYAYRVELGRKGCFGDRAEVGQGNPPRSGFENRLFQPGDDRYVSFQV